jgi:hypothetical protein
MEAAVRAAVGSPMGDLASGAPQAASLVASAHLCTGIGRPVPIRLFLLIPFVVPREPGLDLTEAYILKVYRLPKLKNLISFIFKNLKFEQVEFVGRSVFSL